MRQRVSGRNRSSRVMLITGTFLFVTIASLVVTFIAITVQSTVRAYVAGESQWSKGQRAAVYLLLRYGQTGNPGFYRRFEEAIAMPLGDLRARIELEKPEYDPTIVTSGFLAGGNRIEDIPLLIALFRCCSELPDLERVLSYWRRSDVFIERLRDLGHSLKAEIDSPSPSDIRINELIEELDQLNDQIHPLAVGFTDALGETARKVAMMLLLFTVVTMVVLLLLGTLLTVRTLRGLRDSEQQYRTLMTNAGAGLVVVDRETDEVLAVNRLAETMIGRSSSEIVGTAYRGLFIEDVRESRRSGMLRGPGGQIVDVDLKLTETTWEGRPAWLAVMVDVTERLQTERKLRIANNALAHMSEAVVITDHRLRIISVNQAFTSITGYTAADVIGQRPERARFDGVDGRQLRGILRALRKEGRWNGELHAVRRNGEPYPLLLSIAGVRGDDNRVSHFIGIFIDNSAHRDYERRLRHLANHDLLTELPNRATFEAKCAEAITRAERSGRQLAMLFVDLDGFKAVNDTFGHGAGDRVLRTIGNRLRQGLRVGDLIGRVGGDEFNVLLNDIHSDADVVRLARMLLQIVSEPVLYQGQDISLSASIGISFYPRDGTDFDTLVSHADMAMYEAKGRGRNNYQLFSNHISIAVKTRLALVNALRHAIDRDQFQLYYQPHVELATGRVLGFEALLRWHHPELGWVPPAHFITIAEEMGLIDQITDWVLRTACRQGADWRARGLGDVRIAVNLSPRSFWDRELPRRVAAIIAETGWSGDLLCLEITEGTIMGREDPEELLRRLRDLGIRLAIDDFGVGYSSLGNLRRFPVDVLKIDRSFTSGIPADEDNLALVRTILSLARGLDLEVIAEGIETGTQRDTLIAEGCQQGQGYLFGRPQPASQVEALFLRDAVGALALRTASPELVESAEPADNAPVATPG